MHLVSRSVRTSPSAGVLSYAPAIMGVRDPNVGRES